MMPERILSLLFSPTRVYFLVSKEYVLGRGSIRLGIAIVSSLFSPRPLFPLDSSRRCLICGRSALELSLGISAAGDSRRPLRFLLHHLSDPPVRVALIELHEAADRVAPGGHQRLRGYAVSDVRGLRGLLVANNELVGTRRLRHERQEEIQPHRRLGGEVLRYVQAILLVTLVHPPVGANFLDVRSPRRAHRQHFLYQWGSSCKKSINGKLGYKRRDTRLHIRTRGFLGLEIVGLGDLLD